MSTLFTRRAALTGGIVAAAGAGGSLLAKSMNLIPPDYGGSIYGVGRTLTYASHRLLTIGQPLAREFPRTEISRVAPVNGEPPEAEPYRGWAENGFVDWRLTVDGLVERPLSLSLEELRNLPSETHITLHACEEGWSYIAEWTGLRLSRLLELAGTRPEARYAVFTPYENASNGASRVLWNSIDMHDALHPQTLLAYGMNGETLSLGHGAPLRLRLARHMGYKNTKFLAKITLIDDITLAHDMARRGPWYGGI